MITLSIPYPVARKLKRELGRAGRREIGGCLLAEQLEPGQFLLADLTVSHETGSFGYFVRDLSDHQEELHLFFKRTGQDFERYNYLGEWHSHPSFSVLPSPKDCGSMQELVSEDPSIPFAVLIVVRLDFWVRLTLSATLFRVGYVSEPVRVIMEKRNRQKGLR